MNKKGVSYEDKYLSRKNFYVAGSSAAWHRLLRRALVRSELL
jgi:hypothetical protein